MKITSIRLDNVLPRVFAEDGVDNTVPPRSDVWHTATAFERGKYYCINAESGTGKTSLCSFIMGVRTDYLGHIFFNDTDISSLSMNDWCALRRSSLAYLPQELEIFDELTAIDNVLLKNRLTDFRTEADIRRMFEALEIDHRISRLAGKLSVGQKQRVAIIRALCQPFDFILLDEPVSHLDASNNERCAAMVIEAAKAQDAGVVFTSVGNPLKVQLPFISLSL